jgi:hypothetical protein
MPSENVIATTDRMLGELRLGDTQAFIDAVAKPGKVI